jgi:NADH-quinone oxidoreductase subunit L
MPITNIAFSLHAWPLRNTSICWIFQQRRNSMAAWQNQPAIYYIGLITSGITAFYMFRLYFSIFWNNTHHFIPLLIIQREQ